jgi:hypothetical protein
MGSFLWRQIISEVDIDALVSTEVQNFFVWNFKLVCYLHIQIHATIVSKL